MITACSFLLDTSTNKLVCITYHTELNHDVQWYIHLQNAWFCYFLICIIKLENYIPCTITRFYTIVEGAKWWRLSPEAATVLWKYKLREVVQSGCCCNIPQIFSHTRISLNSRSTMTHFALVRSFSNFAHSVIVWLISYRSRRKNDDLCSCYCSAPRISLHSGSCYVTKLSCTT